VLLLPANGLCTPAAGAENFGLPAAAAAAGAPVGAGTGAAVVVVWEEPSAAAVVEVGVDVGAEGGGDEEAASAFTPLAASPFGAPTAAVPDGQTKCINTSSFFLLFFLLHCF
jgi:hypothetical protein